MVDSKVIHVHEGGNPIRIHLYKGDKKYTWDIHVAGQSLAEIMPMVGEANRKLNSEYGGA